MRIPIILTIFLLSQTSVFCQDTVSVALIAGNWVLSKHTITKNGIAVTEPITNRSDSYEFNRNGAYKFVSRYKSTQYVTKGKWKIIENGKILRLYNNMDIPNDPNVKIADHDLIITRISGEYLLSYSSGDTPNPPETDYYKKKR